MNRITSIAGMNIKGRNFRHQLEPLTIIVGENAAGKTSITDAIVVALLGYHPALGKQPGKTIALAPDQARQMEVEAELFDGGKIRRTFTRTKTGAGAETIGTAPEVMPAQLAFSDFLQAKPTDRLRVLNSLMAAIDYPALSERTRDKMATLGILADVQVTIDPQADNPLEAAIAQITDQGKLLKQGVDIARKTLATLTAVEPPPPVDAAAIAAAEQAVAQAVEDVGRKGQALDAMADLVARAPDEPDCERPTGDAIADAHAARLAAEKVLAEAEAAARVHSTLSQQIQAAKHDANALTTAAGNRRQSERPTLTVEQIDEKRQVEREAINDLQNEIGELSRSAGSNGQEVRTLVKSIHELRESGTCPCCGTTGQALEAAMEAMLARRDAAQTTAEDIEKRIADARLKVDEARGIIAALSACDLELQAWEATDRLEVINTRIAELEAQLPTVDAIQARRDIAHHRAAALAFEQAAAKWAQFDASKPPTAAEQESAAEAFTKAKQARDEAVTALQGWQAARSARHQAIADAQRIADLESDANKAEATIGKIAELRTFLKGEQATATAAAMKPLTDVAGVFLQGIINGTLAVVEHQVGIERGGNFLPLEVLSGMEMLTVSAACQAALATAGDLPILIVDEMARMTPRNRERFAANCAEAIATGVISQAILIDQTALNYPQALLIACD